MNRKIELLQAKTKSEYALATFATIMLKEAEPTDEIYKLVEKTLDKFTNECYNLKKKGN